MFYLFNSEAILIVPEYKYCVLLLNYRHFRKRSLYGVVVLEILPCHNITCMRILACGSRVSQSISQQTSYITADWLDHCYAIKFCSLFSASCTWPKDGRGCIHWSNCWALAWAWSAIRKGLLVSIPMMVKIFLKSWVPLNISCKTHYITHIFIQMIISIGGVTNWMILEIKALYT